MQPSNILHIKTLSEGWRDKDDIVLHACFQLLSNFYEEEYLGIGKQIDWEYDENLSNARKEFVALYEWWQERKKKTDFPNYLPGEEMALYLEENAMLKRLIDVRMYMWT